MIRRCVLLSGGLDSVAALHWALRGDADAVHAIGFSYAQPHRDAELFAAQTIAARRGVPFTLLLLPELRRLDPTAGRGDRGISRAFVPGRNALFLARAAAHAAAQHVELALVMGANADDESGFPDCRALFFAAQAEALRLALDGGCHVRIETPWLAMTKAEIVRWCWGHGAALEDIRDSVSCYRGTRCGTCDACTLRTRAFAEAGIEDGPGLEIKTCGGDPAREAGWR